VVTNHQILEYLSLQAWLRIIRYKNISRYKCGYKSSDIKIFVVTSKFVVIITYNMKIIIFQLPNIAGHHELYLIKDKDEWNCQIVADMND
jgi:hypothetical protein